MEILKEVFPWLTVGASVLVIVINHIKSRKGRKNDEQAVGNYMSEGMCLGLCIGFAFGSEWISLGMMLGLAVGISIKKK